MNLPLLLHSGEVGQSSAKMTRWGSGFNPWRHLFAILIVLSHLLTSTDSASEIGVIGVMADLSDPSLDCQKSIPTSVYEIESIRWIAKILNQNNFTQNIKLEIDVIDLCQSKSSVVRTIELINKYKNGPKKLIALLSMTTSANMLNISWFLSSLPPDLRLIQIGSTETASLLNDRSKYPTFFRIIPDDDYQFQLISKLLVRLKWNYIAILHEDDVFGQGGAEFLQKRLSSLNISVADKLSVNSANIKEKLFILGVDYPNVKGVVTIVQPWTLMEASKYDMEKFRFILSDSVLVTENFEKTDLFKDSFALVKPYVELKKFKEHWKSLFKAEHVHENSIFRKMLEEHSGCSNVMDSSCNLIQALETISKMTQTNYILPKVAALYTIAFVLRKKLNECRETQCPLSALKVNDIQNVAIDFSHMSEFIQDSAINFTGRFDQQGNLKFSDEFKRYLIYNDMKDQETNRYSFRQVGVYNGQNLIFQEKAFLTKLDYLATCPKNKYCGKSTQMFPNFLYEPGDIMLVGIFPIRTGTDAVICPSTKDLSPVTFYGSQLADAMIYAVENINQIYKNLFPGKKIGFLLMDSCNQQISTFKNLLSLFKGDADICEEEVRCSSLMSKILVFIGAFSSEVSIRISQLLTALNRIQLSYGSTSSEFRNPVSNGYPNFIRIVPADSHQIKAMIDICLKMKWFYISMVYSDNPYGLSAKRLLEAKAKLSNICITMYLPFKNGDSAQTTLNRLRERPDAKVVIVFLNSVDLQGFLTSSTPLMKEGEFVFLGSESWGNSFYDDRNFEKLIGSITLGISIAPDPGFERFRNRQELNIANSNPWRVAAMESKCYMPLSLNKKSGKPCPEKMNLTFLGKQHPWAPLVIQTVYAAALGLNKSIALKCKSIEVCKKIFEKPAEVMEIFKEVKLKYPDGKRKRVFDDTGDGIMPYSIYKIVEKNKNIDYVKVGDYSLTSGLNLDSQQINIRPLQCPNEKRCSECLTIEGEEIKWNYVAIGCFGPLMLVLFGILIYICYSCCVQSSESVIEPKTLNNLGNEVHPVPELVNEELNIPTGNNLPAAVSVDNSVASSEDYSNDNNVYHRETTPKNFHSENHSETHPKRLYTDNPAYMETAA